MTVAVLLGLTLQGVAVVIMHIAIRGQWLRHFGGMLLLMSVLYHGVTEIMQWLWPNRDIYRTFVAQQDIDAWILLVSIAMLLYVVGYTLARPRIGVSTPIDPPDAYVSGLKLKWLMLLALPVLVATLQGRGSIQTDTAGAIGGRSNYALGGLALQFLVFLIAVIGAVAIVRFGTRWLLPLLGAQAILLSLAGARSMVLAACVLSLYGASLAGVRASRRQLLSGAFIVLLLFTVISSTRTQVGRTPFTENQTIGTRISALAQGATALPTRETREGLLNDSVYRFDGNAFGALVYGGLEQNRQPVWLTTLGNTVVLAIPSFLYPAKLSASLENRNEETYIIYRFGMPTGVDYLPGLFPTLLAYFGKWLFLGVSLLLGMAFARLDAWVFSRSSPVLFLLGIGLAEAVLTYEQGPPAFILTMRGVLLLMAILWIARLARRLSNSNDAATPVTSRQLTQ